MHIVIAEKDVNGRGMLERVLKMAGHDISIAKSGGHVADALKTAQTNIVLLNVFQCLSSSEGEERNLTIHRIDSPHTALLVSCGGGLADLDEFMALECCDSAFDDLPTKVKSDIMDRIQQMCSALEQSCRHPNDEFNWRRFSLLMELPTEAYLGCRFLS